MAIELNIEQLDALKMTIKAMNNAKLLGAIEQLVVSNNFSSHYCDDHQEMFTEQIYLQFELLELMVAQVKVPIITALTDRPTLMTDTNLCWGNSLDKNIAHKLDCLKKSWPDESNGSNGDPRQFGLAIGYHEGLDEIGTLVEVSTSCALSAALEFAEHLQGVFPLTQLYVAHAGASVQGETVIGAFTKMTLNQVLSTYDDPYNTDGSTLERVYNSLTTFAMDLRLKDEESRMSAMLTPASGQALGGTISLDW